MSKSYIFSTREVIDSDFWITVTVFGLLFLIILLAFQFSYRNSPLAIKFQSRLVIGVAAFLGMCGFEYVTHYNRFAELDVSDRSLTLVYEGPFSHTVVLRKSDVDEIRFGLPDRRFYRQCRLRIIDNDRHDYLSEWEDSDVDKCKALRLEVLQEVKQIGGS